MAAIRPRGRLAKDKENDEKDTEEEERQKD